MSEQFRQRSLTELQEPVLVVMLACLGLAGLGLGIVDFEHASLGIPPLIYCVPLAFATAAQGLRKRSIRGAGWIACGGLLSAAVVIGCYLPEVEAPTILLVPVVAAALVLGPWQSLGFAAIATSFLVVPASPISSAHQTPEAVVADTVILGTIVALLCVGQSRQRKLSGWLWFAYDDARANLEKVRDRQVVLKQTMADLALAAKETVRLNNLLSTSRQAIEEARSAKSEFVARVSHELRTPLNMIIGYSDMILEAPGVYSRSLPSALLADIAAIKRNSEHLAGLVDDVLDLSEIEHGQLQIEQGWHSIGQTADEAAQTVAALFRSKQLDLTVNIPSDTPRAYYDQTRIRQVILNLLSNAGRFTESGGASVQACENGSELLVTVSDTGPGIHQDKLAKVLEPFQQENPSIRRRYGGSGLGLSISKGIVEKHGGRLWLESKAGQGTRACFTLPLVAPPPIETTQRWFSPYNEYVPRSEPVRTENLRFEPGVIVVERGRSLSEMLARHLDGVDVISVRGAREARAQIEAHAAIAVVTNEASAPSGADVAAALGRSLFDVPLISCAVPEQRELLDQIGVQEYLVKPVQRQQLLESIERAAPTAHRILLADDDREAQQLFRRMLRSAGPRYAVAQTYDGESTLASLSSDRPDALLLDLVMPNGDGYAVLRAMASNPDLAAIPVIIVSANDPRREPVSSAWLRVSRHQGLTGRDIARCVRALADALPPRFGTDMATGEASRESTEA